MQYGYLYSHSCDGVAVEISLAETLRYMGVKKSDFDSELGSLAAKAVSQIRDAICPRGCFAFYELKQNGDYTELASMKIFSENLSENLKGCESVVLLALTIGFDADRLSSRYSSFSPSFALAISAASSAAIEGYAERFAADIAGQLKVGGRFVRPRFSPGYGDFDIAHQKDIISILDTKRRIGLSLTDNLMMLPSKSITAVMGISSYDCGCKSGGCEVCRRTDCIYRRNT